MNATASPATSQQESIGTRLRNFALGASFALVLVVAKVLRLRHNPQSWLAFRVLLAMSGASLVIVPLSIANSWVTAIVGLAMFLAAILLPPATPDRRLDEKTSELGAFVVVNGGIFEATPDVFTPVQLFVGAERIHVLDSDLHALLVMSVPEISSANAGETRDAWIFRVRWMERTADFEYRGVFAEHLARVAETTIRSVMHPALPILKQTRAARA